MQPRYLFKQSLLAREQVLKLQQLTCSVEPNHQLPYRFLLQLNGRMKAIGYNFAPLRL